LFDDNMNLDDFDDEAGGGDHKDKVSSKLPQYTKPTS
jgi:hypothetical protein